LITVFAAAGAGFCIDHPGRPDGDDPIGLSAWCAARALRAVGLLEVGEGGFEVLEQVL